MFADLNMLRILTHGAEYVTEKDGAFHFSRFTDRERAVYCFDSDFYSKTFSSSGISFDFYTDAGSFALKYRVSKASSRMSYFFDVFVNGCLFAHEGHSSCGELSEGTLSVSLPAGMKNISVYFPCLVKTEIITLSFDNVSKIAPVEKKLKIISYGDSITQGYDALYPSATYPNRLAAVMNAEVINKGIGGEIFNPALLAETPSVQPDLLTVAYGTNDWGRSNGSTGKELRDNVERFCGKLTALYPATPVFAILPLWRKDCKRKTPAGEFKEARNIIRDIYLKYPAVRIIDGFSLVPHDVSFFSDGCLHPNDRGFAEMSENLLAKIRETARSDSNVNNKCRIIYV